MKAFLKVALIGTLGLMMVWAFNEIYRPVHFLSAYDAGFASGLIAGLVFSVFEK
jgi:hypothetical protein